MTTDPFRDPLHPLAVGCAVVLAVLAGAILAAIAVWAWRLALG